MGSESKNTIDKALDINMDPNIYGTFAEIGAGQEVARNFFLAGRASNTVAKTMSAYDMTFSDEIYGREKNGRYVCESRLNRMLEHEFSLVQDRLNKKRGKDTCFFAFADTVATSKQSNKARCHGWLGLRFQTVPGGPFNDVILHVNMKDAFRLAQQQALGTLGVNLIHGCFYKRDNIKEFVCGLLDELKSERIEVDLLRFSGPDLEHIDNRLVNLELIRQDLSPAVLFDKSGDIVQAAEVLFKKQVVVQRGTFRPITITNEKILEYGLKQLPSKDNERVVLMEISMRSLSSEEGLVDARDFLDRVDTLTALGYNVLISQFTLYYELKEYLRRCTREQITMFIGATSLEKLFESKYYDHLQGGTLFAFGRLFDRQTKMFVYPYKTDDLCYTAKTFNPSPEFGHLYQHLMTNKNFEDIAGCDDVDTSISSDQIRKSLQEGTTEWETLVPEKVRQLIIENGLFNYKGKS
ncbi:MAG: hypothetical protein CL677_07125 [Bdellovibrionaceae bacterium]|nr:hypothetical protein [Pseudobdellovibrionaceae bacterium]|tara:strand:- start:25791 stop:27188 length:1398 start_codon:yes stop_codon:yes gene_type:complete